MRETTPPIRRARAVASALGPILGAGTFIAVLGPFNTGDLGWPLIWVYWVAMISIGSVGGLLANRLLARRCPSWPEPGKWVFSSAAAAAPVVVAVIAVEIWAGGWRPTVANVGVVVFYVLLISLAVTGIQILLVRAQKGAPAADGAAPGRAPFLDRLPSKLKGAQVLAVQAEDHYLRVHTSAGDDLILLRLSDAERELAPLDGLRVHRSWWVARDAVAEVDRAEGRMTLKLKNGLEAPVSRTYARAVREAGWS